MSDPTVTPDSQAQSLTRRLFDRLSRALIPTALLIFIAPFVLLMFYASPAEDDFARASFGPPNAVGFRCPSQLNSFGVAWAQYANIDAGHETVGGSGRWLTSMIQTGSMSTFGLSASYGWLLLLVMATNVCALSYFFRRFLNVPRFNALLAAGVLYAAWLASFSNPSESVYWLTGAIEYQLPVTSLLIVAGLLCRDKQTVFSYIALGLLAIAIPAQHEIAGVFLCVCLFAGVVAARYLKLQLRPWSIAFGLCSLSLASIMLSPAMFLKLKIGHAHSTLGYFSHIQPYAKRAIENSITWALNPGILLATICIPLLLWPHGKRDAEYRPPEWLSIAALGAMCVLMVEYAHIEMASYFKEFPPRLVGFYQFVFVVMFVCLVLVAIPELSKIQFSTGARIGIFMLFAISVLSSGNFRAATRDLRGPARSWHKSSAVRLTQTGNALEFDALPPKPELFKESGLSKDTTCWINQCMATYLHADFVSLRGPKENHFGGANYCDKDAPVK
jgi:hypothetical protein